MEKLERQATQVILEAGDILLNNYRKPKSVSHKGKRDLVTDIDNQVNQFLMDRLTKLCDSGFLGEEGSSGEEKATIWIVDPIDGTTNFIHSYPFFCISVALEVDKQLQIGLVYLPVLDILYHTRRGEGAYENNDRIHVSETAEIIDALMATGFPYKDTELDNIMKRLEKMIRNSQGIRRSGSAATDLCHVARGYVDGFWEQGLKPWDTAAGTLLVQEAGGKLTDYTGKPYHYDDDTLIASNGVLQDKILGILRI